jgi:PhnB protein
MTIHEAFIYLRVRDAKSAISFYEKVFGARELFRLVEPSGRIGHAELRLGEGTLMLSDEYPEYGCLGPRGDGRTACSFHLHVDDADALIAKMVAEGAEVLRPATDHFYGERSGAVLDPFGHEWMIGHSIEELTPEEMQRRYTALFDGDGTTPSG